jgi:hypothetical protein
MGAFSHLPARKLTLCSENTSGYKTSMRTLSTGAL